MAPNRVRRIHTPRCRERKRACRSRCRKDRHERRRHARVRARKSRESACSLQHEPREPCADRGRQLPRRAQPSRDRPRRRRRAVRWVVAQCNRPSLSREGVRDVSERSVGARLRLPQDEPDSPRGPGRPPARLPRGRRESSLRNSLSEGCYRREDSSKSFGLGAPASVERLSGGSYLRAQTCPRPKRTGHIHEAKYNQHRWGQPQQHKQCNAEQKDRSPPHSSAKETREFLPGGGHIVRAEHPYDDPQDTDPGLGRRRKAQQAQKCVRTGNEKEGIGDEVDAENKHAARWLAHGNVSRQWEVKLRGAAAAIKTHACALDRHPALKRRTGAAWSCQFLRRWCARRNAHISLVASMLRLVGPTHHCGSGLPPGQEWPPPWMV